MFTVCDSRVGLVVGTAAALLAVQGQSAQAHGVTERISVGSGGIQGNGTSDALAISADGRFVAFESEATNLIRGDTNLRDDIFVRDRRNGTTERVSVGPEGSQGNGHSYSPAISADGRFVAFSSNATNLVPNDTNHTSDVFVRDRQKGTTERVSIGSDGIQGNNLSFLSSSSTISAGGRFIAFESLASNLVASDTNHESDVFVRDRLKGTTVRVSVGSGGTQANGFSYNAVISADGQIVAFRSDANNLVAGDTNGRIDVFVNDRLRHTTERVSLGSRGIQGNDNSFTGTISDDGRFVTFESSATNLVDGDTAERIDVFIRDREKGTTERVSVGARGIEGDADSYAQDTAIFGHGRFVTFWSDAANLVPGDTNVATDVFVRDLLAGTTKRVSVGIGGAQANLSSLVAGASADGKIIAFFSDATNLVPHDTNGVRDVFVRSVIP